jgi:peptidoglycan/xylan/chitin deacetylase (PgdA/CDA1 family)
MGIDPHTIFYDSVNFISKTQFDSTAYFSDNVGISTTTPWKDLYVDGDISSYANYYQYKKPQCLVTFMLDDGFEDDTTIINMFTTQGEVGSLCIVTDWVDSLVNGSYLGMSWTQLQAYQTAGWEIVSHSKTHVDLRTLTESELKTEFEGALADFENNGITNVNNLVYPTHYQNQMVREVASKYHRAARGNSVQAKNDIVPKTFQLKSKQLNIAPAPYVVDVEAYKDTVDAANADKRWLIFYMHSYEGTPQRTADSVSKIIDYIQSLNIPIVTMNQALDSIGNMITVGDNFHVNERGAKADTIWGDTRVMGNLYAYNTTTGTLTGTGTANTVPKFTAATVIGNSQITDDGTKVALTGYLTLPATTSSTTGVIYKSTSPWAHNYKPAANDGKNTFLGLDAGNFTMSSATAGQALYNTGVGANTLKALTTGFNNTAIGYNALTDNNSGFVNIAIGYNPLKSNTSGSHNVAIGYQSLYYNLIGTYNVAIGSSALQNTTGSKNTAIGNRSLYTNTTGYDNTAVGDHSGYLNSTGNYNIFMGYRAGYKETGSNKLYIAKDSTSLSRAASVDGLLIYGDFDLNYVNIFNRLSIGAAKNPSYALDVTGSVGLSTDLTVGDELFTTGLDSARSNYIVYYNRATGEHTYDSLLTGGTSCVDNMGNCEATQDVDMNDFNIDATDTVNVEDLNIATTGAITMSGVTVDTIATTLNKDNNSIPTCKAVSDAISGYTLQAYGGFPAAYGDLVNRTTYYFGSYFGEAYLFTLSRGYQRIYIPKTGHVKAIYFYSYVNDLGSDENCTLSCVLNGGVPVTISSTLKFNTHHATCNNTSLDIAVRSGDYFELSILTPIFSTRPDVADFSAVIYIE